VQHSNPPMGVKLAFVAQASENPRGDRAGARSGKTAGRTPPDARVVVASEFVTFGAQHFAALGVVFGSAVVVPVAVRRLAGDRAEMAVRAAVGAGCLAFLVFELFVLLRRGDVALRDALPLHLCDLVLLLAPVALLTRRQLLLELLYYWGVGGSLQALLTPALFSGFPALVCLAFFAGHALSVTCALYAVVVLGLRPRRWSPLWAWLITNAYAAAVFPVNVLLNTNYLYIMRKPATPSLLDVLGPWPWYLLPLEAVALGVLLLCYAPFALLRRAGEPK